MEMDAEAKEVLNILEDAECMEAAVRRRFDANQRIKNSLASRRLFCRVCLGRVSAIGFKAHWTGHTSTEQPIGPMDDAVLRHLHVMEQVIVQEALIAREMNWIDTELKVYVKGLSIDCQICNDLVDALYFAKHWSAHKPVEKLIVNDPTLDNAVGGNTGNVLHQVDHENLQNVVGGNPIGELGDKVDNNVLVNVGVGGNTSVGDLGGKVSKTVLVFTDGDEEEHEFVVAGGLDIPDGFVLQKDLLTESEVAATFLGQEVASDHGPRHDASATFLGRRYDPRSTCVGYPCLVCLELERVDVTLPTWAALKTHKRQHHMEQIPAGYSCLHCTQFQGTTSDQVEHHLATTHYPQQYYACSYLNCYRAFLVHEDSTVHLAAHSGP